MAITEERFDSMVVCLSAIRVASDIGVVTIEHQAWMVRSMGDPGERIVECSVLCLE